MLIFFNQGNVPETDWGSRGIAFAAERVTKEAEVAQFEEPADG